MYVHVRSCCCHAMFGMARDMYMFYSTEHDEGGRVAVSMSYVKVSACTAEVIYEEKGVDVAPSFQETQKAEGIYPPGINPRHQSLYVPPRQARASDRRVTTTTTLRLFNQYRLKGIFIQVYYILPPAFPTVLAVIICS